MKKELDERLCAKYPEIFRDRHGNMMDTCMCWGLSVGNGWYHLIDDLCGVIQGHINNNRSNREWAIKYNNVILAAQQNNWAPFYEYYSKWPADGDFVKRCRIDIQTGVSTFREIPNEVRQVVAVQVKEKFGTLRFYVDGADDYVWGAIAMAEAQSGNICDVCGKHGTLGGQGWMSTRCDEHRDMNWQFENDKDELEFLKGLKLDDESLKILDEQIAKRKSEQEEDDES